MRHAYPEWYTPAEKVLKHVFLSGVIALDANILHHLYRLGDEQRHQVLTVLGNDRIRPRLWLPYQVGLEYQRNRLRNAYDQTRVFSELSDEVSKAGRAVKSKFENQISDPEVRKAPIKLLEESIQKLQSELKVLGEKHVVEFEKIGSDDPIRAAIDDLFDSPDSIGARPDAAVLGLRIAESAKRYLKRIPPGYKDTEGQNKKPNPEGDYLIWCELLDHAEKMDKPLLFVTNDEKEDWYLRAPDGKVIGPRPELRAEMATRTNHPYHQTTLTGFLRLADRLLSIQVDPSTIDQVDATVSTPRPIFTAANYASAYESSVIGSILNLNTKDIEIVPNLGLSSIDFTIMRNSTPLVEVAVMHTRGVISLEDLEREFGIDSGRSVPILVITNHVYPAVSGMKVLSRHPSGTPSAIVVEWTSPLDGPKLEAIIEYLAETIG
ncbi:PIN-like domain-containing protein [Nocardia noduli]|uniref:PIN-like domain-containing protein n=1 Tax=Nocardia noduli TaxID=2815722 RepID=UPI0020B1DE01|nr:PIN domain-containing protein [Nocardia noduli]